MVNGSICRDLRAFWGDQPDQKLVVGGPQLIYRTGCEASLSLLTEYKFALSLGHTNTEFHRWTKKVLRKQDKWLKATLKIFTLIAGSPKRVDCRLRKKRAPTLNACQYSLLQTSAERNMRDCAEAPLPCSATLLIQSKEV